MHSRKGIGNGRNDLLELVVVNSYPSTEICALEDLHRHVNGAEKHAVVVLGAPEDSPDYALQGAVGGVIDDGDDALGCCGDAPALVIQHEAGRRLGHGGGPGATSEPPHLILLVVVLVVVVVQRRGSGRTAGGPVDPLVVPGRGARAGAVLLLLLLAGRRGADGDGAARDMGQGRLGPLLAQEDHRGHESGSRHFALPLEEAEEKIRGGLDG